MCWRQTLSMTSIEQSQPFKDVSAESRLQPALHLWTEEHKDKQRHE